MKALNIVIGLLLLAAIIGLGYCNHTAKQAYDKQLASVNAEKSTLQGEINDVKGLKSNLEAEIAELQSKFSDLAEENQSLKGSVADAKAEVRKRNASINLLKEEMVGKDGEMASLRSQLSSLLAVKGQLESEITSLKSENDALKQENQKLASDLATTREEKAELARLNATIQDEVAALTLDNFKANGFTVEVEKKNTKATAKSRWAKTVKVSFDLVAVPEKYQGLRDIYLVITDESGIPIKKANPIATTVSLNGQDTDIMAVSKQNIDISESQRLSFNHLLEERLAKGFYRASVYTDIGLLGASSFRLR